MKNLFQLLFFLVCSQLVLFLYSFYQYFIGDISSSFFIQIVTFTYCLATLYILIKIKKDAESN